jgi:hypothetical protein
MTNKELNHPKQRRDIVKCECGKEIVLLTDVKAMSKAIEVHVAVHLHKLKASASKSIEAKRLRAALIAKVLSIASQPENDVPLRTGKVKAETQQRQAKNIPEKSDTNKYLRKK